MRRSPFVLFVGLVFVFVGISDTGAQEKWEPITIEYHGQSFYIVTSSKGTRIAFDPHTIPEYNNTDDGRIIPKKADVVCISHNHNDHIRVEALEAREKGKKLKILRGLATPGARSDWQLLDEKFEDARIYTVGVYHDTKMGLERGKVGAFVVEVDGWRLVHLGDLGHLLTPAQLKKIGPVDVVMIPVGGIYTINGSEAKQVVQQLKPKEYIFPMHYGTKLFDYTLPPDEFYEDVEKSRIAIQDHNVLTLTRPTERVNRPLIVQLHYWPKEEKKKK